MLLAGTMAVTFAVANLAKIPSYYALGFLDGLNWSLALGLSIVGLCGTVVGRWLVKKMSDRIYTRVIEVLLLVLSIILLTKAGVAFFPSSPA